MFRGETDTAPNCGIAGVYADTNGSSGHGNLEREKSVW